MSSFEREKQLSAIWFQDGLTDDDRTWLREQIELGGERVPAVDISWVTMTQVGGGPVWPFLVLVPALIVSGLTMAMLLVRLWGG